MEHQGSTNKIDLYLSFQSDLDDNVDFEDDLVSITKGSTSTAMNSMREELAEQMWNDYQNYLIMKDQ